MHVLTWTVFTLAALAPARFQEERALFTNPGFEEGLAGWRPLNMSGSTAFEVDNKERAEGRASLRIEKTAAGRPDFLKQSGELTVDAGTVRVSARFKLERGAAFELDAYFFDARGETVGPYVPLETEGRGRGFQETKKELAVPRGAAGFGVNVILREPGTVWIDEVHALHGVPAGAAEEAAVLPSPGFEEGTDGWTEVGGTKGFRVSNDRRVAAGGKRSLRLERKSPRLLPLNGVEARVALGRGKERAVLGLALRAEDGARCVVCLQVLGEGGGVLATAREVGGGDEFARRTLELAVPKGAAKLRVLLGVSGAGRVWFDELALEVE